MIGLLSLCLLFGAIGLFILKKQRSDSKERWLFAGITIVGAVLWASIVLRRPLDMNQLIAAVLDWMI